MVLLKTKRYVFPVILLVLAVGVFLFFSPAQVVRDPSVSEESLVQSSLPSRAPVGYEVPARPVVTFPFTHVSADRLRLGNIHEVAEGEWPVLVSDSHLGSTQSRRSPDGQWTLSYAYGQDPLSITKTGGSGEKRILLTDPEYFEDTYYDASSWKRIPDYDQVSWSWDSDRLFYPVQRGYKEGSESFGEGWVESIDINTGDITRHPGIGFYSNLHSYATARYPTDPVIFEDSAMYGRSSPRGIRTRDGSVSWVIDNFHPLYLSPDKQMVLGFDRNNIERALIYTVDGSKLLYSFDSEIPAHRPSSVYGLLSVSGYQWSPDSSKLAYIDGEYDDRTKRIFSELYVMNLDGTGKIQLTDTPDTAEFLQGWTLDGQLVFRAGTENDGYRWYIADLIAE